MIYLLLFLYQHPYLGINIRHIIIIILFEKLENETKNCMLVLFLMNEVIIVYLT